MAKMSTGAIVAITGGIVAVAGVGLYFALRPKKKTPTAAGKVTPTATKPVQQPASRPTQQQPTQQSGGVNLNVADTISAIGSLFKKKPATTSPIKYNEQGLSNADLFYDEFFKTYGYGTGSGGGSVDNAGIFWEEYFNNYYKNQGNAANDFADYYDYSMYSI